ncbi:uncharacterized protein ACO6RY_05815 [Pungitius sinensis]
MSRRTRTAPLRCEKQTHPSPTRCHRALVFITIRCELQRKKNAPSTDASSPGEESPLNTPHRSPQPQA